MGFRPQQGLTIMIYNIKELTGKELMARAFPSPTGVNYYDYFDWILKATEENKEFPSPTGVNYYD